MSIIDCPKCGKENISETVLKCPACGFKVKAYFDKLKKEEESFKSYSVEEIESLQRATIAKRPMFNQELGIGLGTLAFVVFMFICEYTIIGFIGCIIAFMFLFTGISNLREEQALYDQYKDDAEKYIEAQYKLQENRELEYELIRQVRENQKKVGIKCPNCKSDNVSRISTASRAVSIAAVGLASGKIGKQYECRQCRHRW